jgi:signal transduction histidine kinase
VADSHGGRVEVATEDGEGTRFVVTLPAGAA